VEASREHVMLFSTRGIRARAQRRAGRRRAARRSPPDAL
jgi:hypothetical protein